MSWKCPICGGEHDDDEDECYMLRLGVRTI